MEPGKISVDDMVGIRDLTMTHEIDSIGVWHVVNCNAAHSDPWPAGPLQISQTHCRPNCVPGYTDGENPPVDHGNDMPLDENEQKILDEIERQLYEEDPKLAEMVAKAVRGGTGRWKMRIAAGVFIMGAIVMFISFPRSWAIAGAGFLIMVVSAGWMALTASASRINYPSSGAIDDWLVRLQHRWRRDG